MFKVNTAQYSSLIHTHTYLYTIDRQFQNSSISITALYNPLFNQWKKSFISITRNSLSCARVYIHITRVFLSPSLAITRRAHSFARACTCTRHSIDRSQTSLYIYIVYTYTQYGFPARSRAEVVAVYIYGVLVSIVTSCPPPMYTIRRVTSRFRRAATLASFRIYYILTLRDVIHRVIEAGSRPLWFSSG